MLPFSRTCRRLVSLALILSPAALHAESAVYDGFRPESGYSGAAGNGSLTAQAPNGPAGWQGKWNLPKSGASPAFLFKETAGLSYPAIKYPGGGGVEVTPSDDGTISIGRKFAAGIPMKGNPAIYASFLMSVPAHKPQGRAYVLFSGIGGLGAGIDNGSLMVLSRQDAGVSEDGQPRKEWTPLISTEYKAGETYYFIVKISDGGDEWGGNDDMQVWVNPKDVSSEDAASSNALVNSSESPGNIAPPSGSIGQVLFQVENLKDIPIRFDEVRCGTTWESVTGPVNP